MNVSMKHTLRRDQGFALPTILIASVIMLIVLMSAVTAVSSITGGINSQYYNQLAREAAESGLSNAETCLRVSNFTPTWTNATPLRPDTDCNGATQGGFAKYVISTPNVRTTFTVGLPTVGAVSSVHVVSVGTVELLRTSDPNSPWRTYTVTIGQNSRYNDTPQIAGGAGWKDGGHNGYMLAGSGVLYGWGDNTYGQLGDVSLGITVSTPVKIVFPSGITRAKKVFSSGQGVSVLCILATHDTLGDQVYCRGQGSMGGSTWQRFGLANGLTALDMSANGVNGYGSDSACVLASDSQAYCAGLNDSGNLGNALLVTTDIPLSAPTKFRLDLASPGPVSGSAASLTVKKIFNQDRFTCVVASDNQAYCAGDNYAGQLGQGNTNMNVWNGKSVPGRALIPGNPSVDDVRLPYHSAAPTVFYHTVGSGVYMSGNDSQGTANDGSIDGSVYSTPIQIIAGEYPKLISVGQEGDDKHGICVIAASAPVGNGGLYCMGRNKFGQLGLVSNCTVTAIPTNPDRSAWGSIINLSGQTAAPSLNNEANYQMNTTMVIATPAGDAYAAGDNTYGKLGTGAALQACNPNFAKVQLPAGVKATALAGGDEYTSFVLGDNGKVYAMGRNNNGQLGDGTTVDRSAPVEVQIPRQETVF
jgi:alpha-tubulin suppressor-like RCC1 family protein/Tfp pilus assembly protein PilX